MGAETVTQNLDSVGLGAVAVTCPDVTMNAGGVDLAGVHPLMTTSIAHVKLATFDWMLIERAQLPLLPAEPKVNSQDPSNWEP